MEVWTDTTVAVIDDDDSVRKALGRLLRSAGLNVQTFPSAEEFLAAAPSPVDCLVLDVRLPGLSGLELQRRLAVDGPHIPVVFVTAYQDEQTRGEAAAGAVAVLLKPFEDEALLCAVSRAITRHRAVPNDAHE